MAELHENMMCCFCGVLCLYILPTWVWVLSQAHFDHIYFTAGPQVPLIAICGPAVKCKLYSILPIIQNLFIRMSGLFKLVNLFP